MGTHMTKTLLPAAAAIFVLAALAADARAAADESFWDKFDLASIQTDGVTVRYEKALQPRIDEATAAIREHLAAEARFGKKWGDLLATNVLASQMDKIVGATPSDRFRAERGSSLAQALGGAIPETGSRLYVVTTATIKDYLRGGGSIPTFTYDEKTDKATYRFALVYPAGRTGGKSDYWLVVPVAEPDKAGEAVSQVLSALGRQNRVAPILYAAVEATIIERVKPRDPYCRWLTGGFANVITANLLEEHLGKELVKGFTVDSDVEKFKDIEKDTNLFYWMGDAYEVQTPLESERRLALARYAYSTFEAKRLMDAHGAGSLKAILDRVGAAGARGADLAAAVRAATGEDMSARLARYQRFTSREKAFASYNADAGAAVSRKDYARALSDTLRMIEVNDGYNLNLYANSALLMLRMGHEDYGNRLFLRQMTELKKAGEAKLLRGLEARFVEYALQTGHGEQASNTAEAILKDEPNFVPALVVRLQGQVISGQNDAAAKTAKRVIELERDAKSVYRDYAERVLAKLADLEEAGPQKKQPPK